jgi:hypothetical protein
MHQGRKSCLIPGIPKQPVNIDFALDAADLFRDFLSSRLRPAANLRIEGLACPDVFTEI